MTWKLLSLSWGPGMYPLCLPLSLSLSLSQYPHSKWQFSLRSQDKQERTLYLSLPRFCWPWLFTLRLHRCTYTTLLQRLFMKQVRPTFLFLPISPQHRASGLALGLCTRNLLFLMTLRIEHSTVLSFWNLAGPEDLQKAGLFSLPVGWVPATVLLCTVGGGIRVGRRGLQGYCSSSSWRPSQEKEGGLVNLKYDRNLKNRIYSKGKGNGCQELRSSKLCRSWEGGEREA